MYFQLLNRETHLSLHVEDMSNANGANVVYEFLEDGMHDTFRLIRSGLGNFYHIVAAHSNKVIAVSGSSLEAGANIEQEELVDTSNQDWCFIPTQNGYYQVENRNSGQIIMADFEPNVPNAGKNVYQWYYWGGKQQEWTFQFGAPAEPVDSRPAECMGFPLNTFVHLVAKHSGMSITSEGNGNLNQNTIATGARDNWHMVPGSDGHVLIMNQQSGLAISYDPQVAPSTCVTLMINQASTNVCLLRLQTKRQTSWSGQPMKRANGVSLVLAVNTTIFATGSRAIRLTLVSIPSTLAGILGLGRTTVARIKCSALSWPMAAVAVSLPRPPLRPLHHLQTRIIYGLGSVPSRHLS